MMTRNRSVTGGYPEGASVGRLPRGMNKKCAILAASIIQLHPLLHRPIFFLEGMIDATTRVTSTMAAKIIVKSNERSWSLG